MLTKCAKSCGNTAIQITKKILVIGDLGTIAEQTVITPISIPMVRVRLESIERLIAVLAILKANTDEKTKYKKEN